ncbi:hypothetical protein K523DRAFT_98369 [Schizophyllum commune Tattone D]|nr:hypothetical protein K523DRAFT_98369 [Schizophyllum commune Tattone D]
MSLLWASEENAGQILEHPTFIPGTLCASTPTLSRTMEEGVQEGRSTQLFVPPPSTPMGDVRMKRKLPTMLQDSGGPSTARQCSGSPSSVMQEHVAVEVDDEIRVPSTEHLPSGVVQGAGANAAGPFTPGSIRLVEAPPTSSASPTRRKGPPHICEVCNKHFSRPSMLSTHMNIHTGATPYHCKYPDCLARFNARSNAMRHRFRHGTTFANWQAEADAGEREGEVWAGGEGGGAGGGEGGGAETLNPPKRRPKKMIFVAAEVGPAPPNISPSQATGSGRARRGRHAGSEVRWLPVNQVSRGKDRG